MSFYLMHTIVENIQTHNFQRAANNLVNLKDALDKDKEVNLCSKGIVKLAKYWTKCKPLDVHKKIYYLQF